LALACSTAPVARSPSHNPASFPEIRRGDHRGSQGGMRRHCGNRAHSAGRTRRRRQRRHLPPHSSRGLRRVQTDLSGSRRRYQARRLRQDPRMRDR
jgi:hypothetical protein